MAKKKDQPKEQLPEELTKEEKAALRRPIGVYLRRDVRTAIEQIAAKEDLSRHSILSYAISYFVRQYTAGKIKIEKEQTTRLKLDI
jgi:hypothetical protein